MKKRGAYLAATSKALVLFAFVFITSFVFADQKAIREQIKQAQSLQNQGQFEEALLLLQTAQTENPESKEIERAIRSTNARESRKHFNEGLKLYRKRQYQEAITHFDAALAIESGFRQAANYKDKCLAKLATPVVEETEEISEVEESHEHGLVADGRGRNPNLYNAKLLFNEGRDLINAGDFEGAQEKFEEVLKLNPYHVLARKYIVLLQNRKHTMEMEKQAISEEARMIEVRQEWLPPKKEKVILEVTPPWKTPVGVSEARKNLEAQSQQVIPTINFNNAHLSDVIKYLSKVSGINIIIDESVFDALSAAASPAEQGVPEEEVSETETETMTPQTSAPAPAMQKSDRVTIALKDVPLIEALKYILRAKGLRYLIEDYAIIIVSGDYVPPEDLETRYYHLTSGVGTFTSFETSAAEGESSSESSEMGAEGNSNVSETITIKDILEQSGVPWPEGSKIFLDQRTGTLIVRNTPTNLKIVEDILRTLDVSPYQVAITARFIELETTDAEEMGLDWLLNDDLRMFMHEGANNGLTPAQAMQRVQFDKLTKTIGGQEQTQSLTGNLRYFTTDPLTGLVTSSLTGAANPIISFSGILTRPEFSIVLHAINQKTKNNVLSSPRVTTVNGQRAQIKLVEEFIYPTEYEVTPATTNSQGSVITPPVVAPGSFETRDVGIVLDVTPNVGADRKTINLTIIPEVSEFVTWLDYGVPTQTITRDAATSVIYPGYPILQPLFQTRTVTTSVIVDDGDTVVLGGLIRDEIRAYNDKVPVLGDIPLLGLLFRKKGEISIKKNLVIFVTAELVTPSGEPYAPTQIEPGETIVPQVTEVTQETIVEATPVVE